MVSRHDAKHIGVSQLYIQEWYPVGRLLFRDADGPGELMLDPFKLGLAVSRRT